MNLPVFLVIPVLIFLLLLFSLRISIELLAKETGMTYTVKGSILKHIKVFEIKRGTEDKGKKQWIRDEKEKKFFEKEVLSVYGSVLRNRKGKILHIEKLELHGTFSIEDAAANAVLYGIFLSLWQFLLVFLSAHFQLEHQYFNFLPDFQNNRNELIFHAIFRVVILKVLYLMIWSVIESRRLRRKISNNTE